MKVTAVLRKDQPDKNGLCKILIRINNGQSRKYLATDFKVRPAQFKKGKVTAHERSEYINRELSALMEQFQAGEMESKIMLAAYCYSFISHAEKSGTRSPQTIRYYRGELSKFLKFTNDLPLNKISPDLIKHYQVYMKGLGNCHNTVWKSLKFLKTILNAAEKEGLINKNPFKKVQPFNYQQSDRLFLTAEEVNRIIELEIDPENILYKVARWFLVQCYTGIAVGDLQKLDIKSIEQNGRILFRRGKTGVQVSQPASPEVVKLLAKAGGFNITSAAYNRNLKALAALTKINKNLTSHVGRHTYAMRLAELGISIEVGAKLLGHSKIATTSIYYKIQDERVNEEMKKFRF